MTRLGRNEAGSWGLQWEWWGGLGHLSHPVLPPRKLALEVELRLDPRHSDVGYQVSLLTLELLSDAHPQTLGVFVECIRCNFSRLVKAELQC